MTNVRKRRGIGEQPGENIENAEAPENPEQKS
jgi:hypothetical protein